MEYVTLGSLATYLKNHTLTWRELCSMAQTAAAGVGYLHGETIINGMYLLICTCLCVLTYYIFTYVYLPSHTYRSIHTYFYIITYMSLYIRLYLAYTDLPVCMFRFGLCCLER